MKIIQNIKIKGSADRPMLTDIHFKENGKKKPLVIFVHGFKGFKDWGHFDKVAELFAEEEFFFVKFNFSHNGTTADDPMNFGDLEAFGRNNFILELNDLEMVVNSITNDASFQNEIDAERIYLLGHSRGGGIAILKTGEDARVKKLATWASVSTFVGRHKQITIDTWKKEGVVYAMNARTGQKMPMYYQFYETMIANKERLNINHAVKRLNIPFLIVHGTKDEAVPFHDAEELKMSAKKGELFSVKDADHTFGIRHPFDGVLSPDASLVIRKTLDFFKA